MEEDVPGTYEQWVLQTEGAGYQSNILTEFCSF